jgi:hypothetical protein
VLILFGNAFMWLVTLGYAPSLLFIGNTVALIGLVVSSFVFLTGIFALTKPEYSTVIGYVGIPLSIISLMGALGGLFIGMILGIIGSCLCIAWESDDVEGRSPFEWDSESESESDPEKESDTDEDVSELADKWE